MCNFNRHLNCDTVLADIGLMRTKCSRGLLHEIGIKLARLDILLTAGTGYGSLRNWYAEVDDGEGIREDKYEGVRFFRIL